AIHVAQYYAAASGDDGSRELARIRQHVGFHVAEGSLAVRGENLADPPPVLRLQYSVRVLPLPTEARRQQFGHGRLTGAAIADQEDHSSSRYTTGDKARRMVFSIRSIGGSWPVKRRNCCAACRTNMSTPVMTWQLRARASLTRSVVSGV